MGNSIAKGTMWIMFSQVIFILSNYLIHIFLGRHFGPELYGVFGIVLSLIVLVQVFLQKGLPQAVSKLMAEYKDKQGSIYRESIKIQFFIAVFFTLTFLLCADLIAQNLLKDPSLAGYIRFSSLIILPTAFWALYSSGFLNGGRLFKYQAFSRISQSLLKLVFVFLAVLIGFQVNGIIAAHILAALIAFFIARSFFRIKKSQLSFSYKKISFFAFPIIIFAASYRLIRYLDLLLIKRLLADNSLVGYYTSAMTLSDISLFIFAALPFTLLPSISKSIAEKDFNATRSYINKSLRYSFLFMAPLAFLVSAASKNLIVFFYSSRYLPAASCLSLLVFGATFLSLFSINCSIITGGGRPKTAMFFGLILIPLSVALNYLLIPYYGILGAASATTSITFFGVIITSAYIHRVFKTLVSFRSVINISLASLIVYYLALKFQFSGAYLILVYLALFMVYLSLLIILNEVKKADIDLIWSIFKRKTA